MEWYERVLEWLMASHEITAAGWQSVIAFVTSFTGGTVTVWKTCRWVSSLVRNWLKRRQSAALAREMTRMRREREAVKGLVLEALSSVGKDKPEPPKEASSQNVSDSDNGLWKCANCNWYGRKKDFIGHSIPNTGIICPGSESRTGNTLLRCTGCGAVGNLSQLENHLNHETRCQGILVTFDPRKVSASIDIQQPAKDADWEEVVTFSGHIRRRIIEEGTASCEVCNKVYIRKLYEFASGGTGSNSCDCGCGSYNNYKKIWQLPLTVKDTLVLRCKKCGKAGTAKKGVNGHVEITCPCTERVPLDLDQVSDSLMLRCKKCGKTGTAQQLEYHHTYVLDNSAHVLVCKCKERVPVSAPLEPGA